MTDKEFKRYRCDICGRTSEKMEECCGMEMKDLLSPSCMGCQGCGLH